jgi:hypothetical protein
MNSLSPKSGVSYISRTNPRGLAPADEIAESLQRFNCSEGRNRFLWLIAEMMAGAEIWAEFFGTSNGLSERCIDKRRLISKGRRNSVAMKMHFIAE